jgi:hypothetical protein
MMYWENLQELHLGHDRGEEGQVVHSNDGVVGGYPLILFHTNLF